MKGKMMRKALIIAAVCMSVVMVFAFVGCSSKSSSSTDSGKYKLIVGFDKGYPPYGYVGDDGKYTGFDLELAQEVAKRQGWDVELTPIDWDTKDAQLDSGAITCIWNGFTYEGREDKYAWSDRYMLNEQVVVVKNDSDYSKLEDLVNTTVVTQADSAALNVLKGDKEDLSRTFKALETAIDYNNAFMLLESGAVNAVACDLSIANYQMAAKPNAYKILGTLSSEHYAVGFKLGDQQHADAVTATLKEMDKDGFIKTLCEKYADQGMSYDNWVLGK